MDWNCVESHRLLAFVLSLYFVPMYFRYLVLYVNRHVGIYSWRGYRMLNGGGTS